MLAGIPKLIECGFEFELDFEWDFKKYMLTLIKRHKEKIKTAKIKITVAAQGRR